MGSVTDQVSHVTWATCGLAVAVSINVIPDRPVGRADMPFRPRSDQVTNY
jgi:hypothetical protein